MKHTANSLNVNSLAPRRKLTNSLMQKQTTLDLTHLTSKHQQMGTQACTAGKKKGHKSPYYQLSVLNK